MAVAGWQLWAFLAAVFAAATAIFAKVATDAIDPDLATLIRTAVVLVVLAALLAVGGKLNGLSAVTPKAAIFLVLSGLATGASWVCYFRALKLGDASRVAPVDKLSVVLVAVFAAVFLGERLTAGGWAGVALIAAGAILVARS
ncbi:MAG: EamA family transporter [Tepidamorphaceae bacterium]|nr:EamA family transporter [Rhodobiaceae bacterium]MCC0050100.1 EamA family transporter [Rhodobiaceae bacterium]